MVEMGSRNFKTASWYYSLFSLSNLLALVKTVCKNVRICEIGLWMIKRIKSIKTG